MNDRRALALATLARVTAMSSASMARAGSPYATSIVAQTTAFGNNALYNDPNALLGEPTRIAVNADPTAGNTPFHIKIIEAAYNRDVAGNKTLTTFGRKASSAPGGYDYGSVTVKFDQPIRDDPANPYGIDLNVFGNAFYANGGAGGFISDTTDLRNDFIAGGAFDEPVVISVSPDNVNWYTYSSGPYGDTEFPTQGYAWSATQHDQTGNGWTNQKTDFTKPVNPTLNAVLGTTNSSSPYYHVSAAGAIDAYVNSGGGTGIDLAPSGFASIQYVRVESTAQFRDGEIDAFADVRPMQVGEALSITPENVTAHTALFFQSQADPTRTAMRADFTNVSDLAKLSTATFSDATKLSLITNGEVLSAYAIDVTRLIGTGGVSFAANLSLLPGLTYEGDGRDLAVQSWNGTGWTPIAFSVDAASGFANVGAYSSPSGVLAISVSTYTYLLNADSAYSNPTAFAWSGAVPTGGNNGRVLFGASITAAHTITLDHPIALASLAFDNSNSYTLAGAVDNTITLNGSSPIVTVRLGSHTIAAPVVLASNTRFDIAANSALSIAGSITAVGKDIVKLGTGTLTLPATRANTLTVSAGTLATSGTAETVVRNITVDAGAVFDIGQSALVIDYDAGQSPLDRLRSYVVDGRVTSAQLRFASNRAVGYLDSAAVPSLTSYGSTALDATTLLFAVTLKGDATLDKTVNFDDLIKLAQNYNGVGKQWYDGDFNYDGTVNFDDLIVLAQNYNGSLTPNELSNLHSDFAADFALAQSLVPEPGAFVLVGLSTVAGVRRRRYS